jgi:histidine ammonia-lyase
MAAIGTLFLLAAERLTELADVAGALTLEALGGTHRAFHPLLQAARPHPGQRASAERIRDALEGSERAAGEDYARIQDAYSLRCMPQVHGAVRQSLAHLREILNIEINSATDNPLIFPDEGEIISGGNFHGQPLALALDYAAIAVAALGSISERRTERLVNPQLSGLPAFLAEESGLNSGYMLAQYTAAALVSENKVLAHPASVDSIPSSANQEDHVSMGAHAARKATSILRNVEQTLAIELNVASQAVEFGQGRLGRGTAALYDAVRAVVPRARADRSLAPDFAATVALIRTGVLLDGLKTSA